MCRRGTCATPTPTRPWPNKTSGSCRRFRSKKGFKPSTAGSPRPPRLVSRNEDAEVPGSARAPGRAGGRVWPDQREKAAGRHARTRQVPLRARQGKPRQETLAGGARILPPIGRQLPDEPVPRGRETGDRGHVSRRAIGRSLRARDQRVSRVSEFLSNARAGALRAVPAGDGALAADAVAHAGPDGNP